jgi:ribosomal protein S18 acetylase RimI-like enzyme
MSRTGVEVTFRPFRVADQDNVRSLILDGLGDHFREMDASLNPDLEDINASYADKGHAVVVAESDAQIVAVGALVGLDEQVGRIVRVSVATGCRRRGIGTMIVAQLIKLAHDRQYRRILVETNRDWREAVALYHRCGFRTYARDDISIHMDLKLDGE